MIYNSELDWLSRNLEATESLLEMSKESPLMTLSLESRISDLKHRINNLGKLMPEPRIDVWYSGDAVLGSRGISTPFMEKTMHSLAGMVKSSSQQKVKALRAQKKKADMPKGQFYITGLTHGSFGYEMVFKELDNIFDDDITANSIRDVMELIERTASSDVNVEELIQEQPLRLLSHMKDFLTIVRKQKSTLRMQSGSVGLSLDVPHVDLGYKKLCESDISYKEEIIRATFQGCMIESGKFEYTDEDGKVKHGQISEDLTYDEVAELNRNYSRKECSMSIIRTLFSYSNGKKSEHVELTGISD